MKSDVKGLWVDALRSGKYRQGFGNEALSMKGDLYLFCPIGVLGKVFEKVTGQDPFIPMTGGEREPAMKISHKDFASFVGTSHWPPQDVVDYYLFDKVVVMNDLEKKSFREIADYIEGQ